jgi:putative Mg2+ transporter-C (MgtC) family protein
VPPAEDQVEIIARLLLAAALGGFIGLERELRGYPAGIRTIALVALGSCLFTEISLTVGAGDRIAAQVVTGIGFIGAGVIFREGGGVRGITTAATIWAAAAIGMAVGVELYIVATAGAAIVFFMLWARPFTRYVEESLHDPESRLRRMVTPEDNDEPERRDD